MKDDGAPRTARARVRDELTREITDVARRHLAEQGSAALSQRAIARDLGMVSSAIYRYFPSRDDLLTALIVDAYTDIGEAAGQAEAKVPRTDLLGRWLALTHAARHWAVAHPQEYALIFGSPVPGYKAPQDTVDPAARIPFLILQLLGDTATEQAGIFTAGPGIPFPETVSADLQALVASLPGDLQHSLGEHQLARGVMAWCQLIGLISFELFGHLYRVIYDYEAHFDYQMRIIGARLGLSAPA